MKAHISTYTIPSMPVKEIVECLSESGFNILVTDITNPNSSYIVRLYEGILSIFLEETVPETADESTNILIVYGKMKKFLERIGMGTIQIKDITHPEPVRTVKILSAVINFAMFKEKKRHILSNIYRKEEEIDMIVEETDLSIEKNENILYKIREEKKSVSKEIKRIEREISEKETEIINYHRIQQSIAVETEEISKENRRISESINSEKCEIVRLSQDITKLRASIVKNPEQLKELLIGMVGQIEDETEIVKEYERRISVLHSTIAMFQKITEELKGLMCTVSLVGEYTEKAREMGSHHRRLENENNSLEIENRTGLSKRLLLEKKISYIVEKISALTEEDRMRMAGLKKEFDILREKHQKVSEQREHTQILIYKNNEEIKKIEKDIIKIESSHESKLSSVYNTLFQQKNFLAGYKEDIEKVFRGEYVL